LIKLGHEIDSACGWAIKCPSTAVEAVAVERVVTIEAIEQAKPAPAFLQMGMTEHSAKLLRVWRIRRQ
jgi:hypothetical protein